MQATITPYHDILASDDRRWEFKDEIDGWLFQAFPNEKWLSMIYEVPGTGKCKVVVESHNVNLLARVFLRFDMREQWH